MTTATLEHPDGYYYAPEDVILESVAGGWCDWCDQLATASVRVYSGGRTITHDDRACEAHVREWFGPSTGRIITDNRGPVRVATRTTRDRAAAHFHAGGSVVVSVCGRPSLPVTSTTVTHAGDSTAWRDLVATVTRYGDTRQAYYVVGGAR